MRKAEYELKMDEAIRNFWKHGNMATILLENLLGHSGHRRK